jgi:hypothetical protein
MSKSDAFALANSGFNAFLFARVGTEINGSELTVLSVLARLGQDPWDQAAQWIKLSKAEIIDRLTASITQMPLSPQALRDARQTATRLILLLPAQGARLTQLQPATTGVSAMPGWMPMALFAGMVAFAIATAVMMPHTIVPTVASSVAQTDSLQPVQAIN